MYKKETGKYLIIVDIFVNPLYNKIKYQKLKSKMTYENVKTKNDRTQIFRIFFVFFLF